MSLWACEEPELRVFCASESAAAFERRWAEFVLMRPEYASVRRRMWVRPAPLPSEAAAWGGGWDLLAVPGGEGACLGADSLAFFEYGAGLGEGWVLPPGPSPLYAAARAWADSLDPLQNHRRIFAFEYPMYDVYAKLGACGGFAFASEARRWGGRIVATRPALPHTLAVFTPNPPPAARDFYAFVVALNCAQK
jgi:hypothetical protein